MSCHDFQYFLTVVRHKIVKLDRPTNYRKAITPIREKLAVPVTLAFWQVEIPTQF